jgi:hypothetical protein
MCMAVQKCSEREQCETTVIRIPPSSTEIKGPKMASKNCRQSATDHQGRWGNRSKNVTGHCSQKPHIGQEAQDRTGQDSAACNTLMSVDVCSIGPLTSLVCHWSWFRGLGHGPSWFSILYTDDLPLPLYRHLKSLPGSLICRRDRED